MENMIVGALTLLTFFLLILWYGFSKLSQPVASLEKKFSEVENDMSLTFGKNASILELSLRNAERLQEMEDKLRNNEILIKLLEEQTGKRGN